MKTRISLLLLVSLGFTTASWAEVLEMPEAPQELTPPADTMSFTVPGRGMTKEQVEERFGTPTEKEQPVGDPPITRWNYSEFTVYFEYDIVLHSVLHTHSPMHN